MVQTALESWRLPVNGSAVPNDHGGWTGKRLSVNNVHLFCVSDITEDALIRRVELDSTTNNAKVSSLYWDRYNGMNESNDGGTLLGDTMNTTLLGSTVMHGLRDSCFWNGMRNNDISKEAYLPLSSSIQIQFQAKMTSDMDTKVVRVDIVKQRRIPPKSGDNDLLLPEAAIGLRHLCDNDMLARNQFNPKYFQVIKTSFIYLSARGSDTTMKHLTGEIGGTVPLLDPIHGQVDGAVQEYVDQSLAAPHIPYVRKTFKYTHVFPHKVKKLDLNAQSNDGFDRTYEGETLPHEKVWCIISCSDYEASQNAGATGVQFSMRRTNKWRDQHGTD